MCASAQCRLWHSINCDKRCEQAQRNNDDAWNMENDNDGEQQLKFDRKIRLSDQIIHSIPHFQIDSNSFAAYWNVSLFPLTIIDVCVL